METTINVEHITPADKNLVAAKLGCDVSFINKVLSGKRNTDTELAKAVMRALQIAADFNTRKEHEIELLERGL